MVTQRSPAHGRLTSRRVSDGHQSRAAGGQIREAPFHSQIPVENRGDADVINSNTPAAMNTLTRRRFLAHVPAGVSVLTLLRAGPLLAAPPRPRVGCQANGFP